MADGAESAASKKSDAPPVLIGEDAQIPEDFPKDVPLYKDMKIEMCAKGAAEGVYTLSAVTPDTYGQVVKSFKEQAKANQWTEEMSADQGGLMYTMTYSKDSRTLSIKVIKDDAQSSIMLALGKAAEK